MGESDKRWFVQLPAASYESLTQRQPIPCCSCVRQQASFRGGWASGVAETPVMRVWKMRMSKLTVNTDGSDDGEASLYSPIVDDDEV